MAYTGGMYLIHNSDVWHDELWKLCMTMLVLPFRSRTGWVLWRRGTTLWQEGETSPSPTTAAWKRWAGTCETWYHNCVWLLSWRTIKRKLIPSGSFNLDELFKQEFLHISEPDLVYVDGPPHSPCPSSASFSSSHIPSPELYPVRLQEVKCFL